ncbi:uncharacterized protein LOC132735747 isoform X2 [Ruditapes philippinarum]|uniref:uncharacterized protein LOC132735747 isoform X2 n=1 Tax=Ruditapes philippinarum TaxID=129788 RepID=UPI00295B2A72|nr:uncharacterized protein LOC132735747 isoform X2 [Ruditapes philippinarum]
MDKDREDTNGSDKGQGSEDEESEEIEEVLEGVVTQDEDSGTSEEPMMVLEQKTESPDQVKEESFNKSLSFSTEESESSTIDEKQYQEDKEITLEDKEIDLGHSGQHDTLQSADDPIISDEDDSDRMEQENKLTKSNLKEVVSDMEISEIVMQDPPSDREIVEGEEDQKDDESDRNSYIHSVSDDTELNVSADNYMDFPTTMQKRSFDSGTLQSGAYARLTPVPSSTPNKSVDTDDIINAVYDRESVVSDIFEPNTDDVEEPSTELKFSRYDSLRSKYTRPRPPPHRSEDPSLTYLPARGVRSYAPFLQSSPLAGLYMGYEQRLEDSVLKDKDTEDYTVRGEGDSPSKIPARIREIITKNLASDDKGLRLASMSTPTPQQLQEENRLLSTELNRVEDLLAASRAERDELGIKYNALSEKLEQSLRGDSLDASDSTSKPLLQQKH